MKEKVIQLILIERLRMGVQLSKIKEDFDAGKAEPPPSVWAELNSTNGRLHALLWVLKQLTGERFESLVETMGFHSDDEDVRSIGQLDLLIKEFGPLCGEIAASAVRSREEEPEA